MLKNKFSEALTKGSDLIIVAELAAGPGYNFNPIQKFLEDVKKTDSNSIPKGFDFVGITVTQNPGGISNLEPIDVLSRINDLNLMGDLDFIPHISCKDHNTDAIKGSLINYRQKNIQSVLAITGDKPVGSKGIFELESIGLLQLIERINHESYLKSKSGQFDNIKQFFPGAAVSPFKYTEGSQMQQYYKMEKKIKSGAKFLITQVGWDWKKSAELFQYLKENNLDVPVLGDVFLLSTTTPAPRLMHAGKLPGCFVSDELLSKLQGEKVEQHIERAAQQLAMYKELGAAGVDIGGVHDFDTFVKILNLASQIGKDWEKYKDNLCWPGGEKFYLYEEPGKKAVITQKKKAFRQKNFDFMHRIILDPDYTGFKLLRNVMSFLGTKKGKGFFYKSFYSFERVMKYLLFDCQDCGDCYLPENFSYCTIGGCEKGLSNAPCGDSTVEGLCGNNLERICIGDLIYNAAAAKENGRELLKSIINQPRMFELENTASILNYLFGYDHTKTLPIISISDILDAYDPLIGEIMKQYIQSLNQKSSSNQDKSNINHPLNFLKALIQTQAESGASYISVNIDMLIENDISKAEDIIRQLVKLIQQSSNGIAVCIDSQYEGVLIAGLYQWYDTDTKAKPPLLGPVKLDYDKLLSLRKEFDFNIISSLDIDNITLGNDEAFVNESLDLAEKIKSKVTNEYQFKPENIFLELKNIALTEEISESLDIAGRTLKTFTLIKEIKNSPVLKKCHCLLRINNATKGIQKRRIGINRAYLVKVMDYGLDSVFADMTRHYVQIPADPDLIKIIEAFLQKDNPAQKSKNLSQIMAPFMGKYPKPPAKN